MAVFHSVVIREKPPYKRPRIQGSYGSNDKQKLSVMILSFRTDRPGKTEEQSDQGLFCLQFRLLLFGALLYGKATLFKFRVITVHFSSVRMFRIVMVCIP